MKLWKTFLSILFENHVENIAAVNWINFNSFTFTFTRGRNGLKILPSWFCATQFSGKLYINIDWTRRGKKSIDIVQMCLPHSWFLWIFVLKKKRKEEKYSCVTIAKIPRWPFSPIRRGAFSFHGNVAVCIQGKWLTF